MIFLHLQYVDLEKGYKQYKNVNQPSARKYCFFGEFKTFLVKTICLASLSTRITECLNISLYIFLLKMPTWIEKIDNNVYIICHLIKPEHMTYNNTINFIQCWYM